MGSGAKVLLSGGAQAGNIFWQVGGGVGAEIGTTAHVEGTLLAAKAIHFRTGASLNGRALSQTAVTLAKNRIVIPASSGSSTMVKVFTSEAALDGWVLESTETSEVGGTLNTGATTFNVGDNAQDRQFRGILSFDTSGLPDNAVILKVMIKIKPQSLVGQNPFLTHGGLKVDIQTPFFGTGPGLAISDFEALAGQSAVGTFRATPLNNWYVANLGSAGYPFISLKGRTQLRLRFLLDDNDDMSADYMMFYSGNVTATLRPQLVITYSVP